MLKQVALLFICMSLMLAACNASESVQGVSEPITEISVAEVVEVVIPKINLEQAEHLATLPLDCIYSSL